MTLEMFCESAAQEHPDSVKLLLDLANILGEALGMAVNILAPEVVVLSGQLAQLGELSSRRFPRFWSAMWFRRSIKAEGYGKRF